MEWLRSSHPQELNTDLMAFSVDHIDMCLKLFKGKGGSSGNWLLIFKVSSSTEKIVRDVNNLILFT